MLLSSHRHKKAHTGLPEIKDSERPIQGLGRRGYVPCVVLAQACECTQGVLFASWTVPWRHPFLLRLLSILTLRFCTFATC